MSESKPSPSVPAEDRDAGRDDSTAQPDADELRARIEALRKENDRLRREYVRARRSEHTRAALALALLGVVAFGAAAVLTEYRDLLLALGGTGLFGAVLTYYLSPSSFVPATVNERVHAAHATNQASIIDELGLQPTRVYVPTPEAVDPAVLFVPQHEEYTVPDPVDRFFVVGDDDSSRGIALVPAGSQLYEEFEATVTDEPADSPAALATQLADAAVEVFELATAARATPDLEADRAVVTVSDPVYGDVDAPDHPLVSLIGVGLASGLDTPVTVEVEPDDSRGDARLVFEW